MSYTRKLQFLEQRATAAEQRLADLEAATGENRPLIISSMNPILSA